jgi:alpha-tubulin suppressor-like RCC1 family protein
MTKIKRIKLRGFILSFITLILVLSFQNCSSNGLSSSNDSGAGPEGATQVPGLINEKPFANFAINESAVCGVKGKQLFCWGTGVPGAGPEQRGTDLVYTAVPLVVLNSEVTKVAAGSNHFCAISAKSLFCWGNNYHGQIGDGTTVNKSIPIRVFERDVNDVEAADSRTCVISEGDLYCWGQVYSYNPFVNQPPQLLPSKVDLPKKVSQVALASNGSTCVIYVDTSLACWGSNDGGVLGDGTSISRNEPQEVFSAGASKVDLAYRSGCAIVNQELFCWGGQYIGDGTGGSGSISIKSPTKVMQAPVSDLSIDQMQSCAIQNENLYCWGYNRDGRLGLGTWQDVLSPTLVMSGGIVSIAARNPTSCASRKNEAFCWGSSVNGRMGPGYQPYVFQPRISSALSGITDIKFGHNFHGCGLKNDKVYCWGYGTATGSGNQYQQQSKEIHEVLSGGVSDLVVAQNLSCAIKNGDILCWGDSLSQLLPAPAPVNESIPRVVMSGPIESYSARFDSLCAIKSGQVFCIGRNDWGQLGRTTLGTSDFAQDVPTNVPGVVHSVSISHSGTVCALSDQGMFCWGDRGNGVIQTTPVQESNQVFNRAVGSYNYICAENSQGLYCKGWIPGGPQATAMTLVNPGISDQVLALRNRICVRKNQQISCRGERVFGSPNPWTFPVESAFQNLLTENVDEIFASDWEATTGHSFCVRKGIENWCWGNNNYDQLGFSSKQINTPQKLQITW